MNMKMLKAAVIGLCLTLTFSNCSSLVRRWPDRQVAEISDKTLALSVEKNIFREFLWTTPPLYGRSVTFGADQKASLPFAGGTLELVRVSERSMKLVRGGKEYSAGRETSEKDCYYNLDKLPVSRVTVFRYVPESRMTTERVAVQKSRMVTRSVMKTRSVYDPASKSTRFETYPDMETVAEQYTDWETRTVWKTEWVWRPVAENRIDIPEYGVFRFELTDGVRLILYAVEEGGRTDYFIQHVNYLSAREQRTTLWGQTVDVRTLIIDADCNGAFFDETDRVLFNTWNPYARDSQHRELTDFFDNRWYQFRFFKENNFLEFSSDPGLTQLSVVNANSKYINDKGTGRISFANVDAETAIRINGRQYRLRERDKNRLTIEYGVYRAVISRRGHLDFVRTFVVDARHPEVNIEYAATEEAGTFTVVNHGFRNWKMSARDASGNEYAVFNANEMNLKPGAYTIIISDGQTDFSKEIEIKTSRVVRYDFAADLILGAEDE